MTLKLESIRVGEARYETIEENRHTRRAMRSAIRDELEEARYAKSDEKRNTRIDSRSAIRDK